MRNSRPAGLFRAALVLALGITVGRLEAAGAARSQPPNFLVILGDNIGKDWFGCYGSEEGATPHIDRLARTGVRFAHCYVTPLCSTTRASLFTGRYAYRTGWRFHHDTAIYGGGYFDWEREVTFARALKSSGYATAITGKWQINDLYDQKDALRRHGFDEHLVWTGAMVGEGNADRRWRASVAASKRELESRYWDPVVFRNGERKVYEGRFGPDLYVDFLIDFIKRNRDRPFLAFYSTPLVHVPAVITPQGLPADAPEREKFAGMVHYMDRQVGKLIETLETLRLRENTIVIITTDNGTPRDLGGRVGGKRVTGGLGGLRENGLDVPLIVNCPAWVPSGQFSDRLTDCTDIFPSLLDLAGTPPPKGVAIDGRSFADVVRGKPDPRAARSWIFTQYANERVVRDERYKLYASGAFYDLGEHPLENVDLAGRQDPEIAGPRRRLQEVLRQLPADVPLPFEPRSQSAFRLREKAATK